MAELRQVGFAGEVDHGRGAAHEGEGVGGGGEQVLGEHLLADEPCAVVPVCEKYSIKNNAK